MKKILLLGPRYKEGRTIGGSVVLFENLIDELQKKNVQFTIIDTNKASHKSRLNSIRSILYNTAIQLKRHDIVIINSSGDYLFLLPSIFLLNVFHRKKIFLRKFGGEIDQSLNHKFEGPIIKYYFPKLAGLFLEAKFLVERFKVINPNVIWFPNVRERPKIGALQKIKFSGKFVFISQIKPNKGIKELIEAFKDFNNGYTLDFYGPLMTTELKELMEEGENVNYKGELNPKDVYTILNQYDLLILPTYFHREGYPGIIIEAYACGKPVITTNWRHIPEIVENGKTGYLIEPKSSLAIKQAIEGLTDEIYQELARNALKKFDEFDSAKVTERILQQINIIT